MVSLLGYYLSIMAGLFKGSILIKILSYVPFLSCLLSPALLVIGQIGIVDVLISILVLLALIYVLVKYGLKIYKIGILNYSTDKMWNKLFKAIKSKEWLISYKSFKRNSFFDKLKKEWYYLVNWKERLLCF